jgi:carboxypeptidase Taq
MTSRLTEKTVSADRNHQAYDELINHLREASLLAGTADLLSWDREVMMPAGGLEYRSKQLAQIARLQHEVLTSKRMEELLMTCEVDPELTSDPRSCEAVNIREIRRSYDRQTKLPASLVQQEAELGSYAQHEWAVARRSSDFKHFQPWLAQCVELLRRKADCYGWACGGEPWDALAEDYEPGCTAAQVIQVFTPLRVELQQLLSELTSGPQSPSNAFNELELPIDRQEAFVRFVAETIGFDFGRGRLDRSTHPFCSGTHGGDVRLTTRFHNANVNDALGSTMHEAGHGIYEQGLLATHWGTPMSQAVSLSIHESQSRLWENQVGRSNAFWKWLHPQLNRFFGNATDGLSLAEVYGGANIVKPDLIRVEADEATYNMHIMIRFEIERALMTGDLPVADVPDIWNQRYKEYLGIEVPDDARGCLQDIHWSMLAIGYFPTYALGNLYSAQFFESANEAIPELNEQFEQGEFGALKQWLNENIHAHGKRYTAAELCQHVTGKPLSAAPLMRHLEHKLRPLYGL